MKISACLLLIASILSLPAFATKDTKLYNDQLLLASCQELRATPELEEAKACLYFIEGFLAATRAINPPTSKIKRRPYGLMSRPYSNWARTKPKNIFPFCVPDNLSKAQIVTTISKQLTNQLETTEMLNENILKVLKTEYPCGKSNQK